MSASCSIFHQLLTLFPRGEFDAAVERHNAERHSRGFRCWSQFVAMLYCQLSGARSLREICGGLACSFGKLNHLGLAAAPARSTLAYANERRPWQLYQDLFFQLQTKCDALRGKRQGPLPHGAGKLPRKLVSIDASLVSLAAEAFDWAPHHRRKGALKLHLALDHDGYLPCFATISDPNKPEVTVAREWAYPRGATLLFDKAFNDYKWYGRLCDDDVFFVTRLRRTGRYEVLETRETHPSRCPRVVRDEIIRLGVERRTMKHRLRRVEFKPREGHAEFVLLTNHLDLDPETLIELYSQRWRIEQFFRLLKQNLLIKTFVGTSANAVLTQIWTALIAMLLLKYLQLRARRGWSFSTLAALLRLHLFVYRDLQGWLDEPFEPPPEPEAGATQLTLQFARA